MTAILSRLTDLVFFRNSALDLAVSVGQSLRQEESNLGRITEHCHERRLQKPRPVAERSVAAIPTGLPYAAQLLKVVATPSPH